MCALSLSPMPNSRPDGQHGGGVSRAYARVLDQTLAYDDRQYAKPLAQICAALRAHGAQVVQVGAMTRGLLEGAWARVEPDGADLLVVYNAGPRSRRIACLALIHEFAHILLHWRRRANPRPDAPQWRQIGRTEEQREVEAELATCVVAEHLGIPHPGGVDYVLAWDDATSKARERAQRRAHEAADCMIAALAACVPSEHTPPPRATARRRDRSPRDRPRPALLDFARFMLEEISADPRLALLLPESTFAQILKLGAQEP